MSLSFITFFGAGLCSLLLATTVAEASGRRRPSGRLNRDEDGPATTAEDAQASGAWARAPNG